MRNIWIDESRARSRRARTFTPQEDGGHVGTPGHTAIEASAETAHVDGAMAALPPTSARR